jgi:hypothetical protein
MAFRPHASRATRRFKLAPLAVAAALLSSASISAVAEPIPPGWQAQDFEPVGFTPVPSSKLAIRQVAGRWYLYTAARPGGIYVIDVTDPANP